MEEEEMYIGSTDYETLIRNQYSNIEVKALIVINADKSMRLWSEMSMKDTIKFMKKVKKYEKTNHPENTGVNERRR